MATIQKAYHSLSGYSNASINQRLHPNCSQSRCFLFCFIARTFSAYGKRSVSPQTFKSLKGKKFLVSKEKTLHRKSNKLSLEDEDCFTSKWKQSETFDLSEKNNTNSGDNINKKRPKHEETDEDYTRFESTEEDLRKLLLDKSKSSATHLFSPNSFPYNDPIRGGGIPSSKEIVELLNPSLSNSATNEHCNGEDLVEAFFQKPRVEITPKSVNILLRSLGSKGKYLQAKEVFERMKEFSILPNTYHYTSMIAACAKCRKVDEAFQLLKEMKDKKKMPSIWTYNTVISACTNVGQLDRAFSVLSMIKEDNLVPDNVVYTSLLSGCVQRKQFQRAQKLWDFIKLQSLYEPDEVSFTVMIDCYAQMDMTEKAMNLYEEMLQRGMHPTEFTYNKLIYACARRQDFYAEAFVMFSKMKECGFPSDSYTLLALLHACSRNGDVERAHAVGTRVFAGAQKPPLEAYSSLLGTYARAQRILRSRESAKGHARLAEAIVEDMRIRELRPDTAILNALMSVYAEGGFLEKALAVLEWFPRLGKSPDLHSFTVLVTAYMRVGLPELAVDIRNDVARAGLQPDLRLYRHLLRACAKARFIRTGVKLLEELRDLKWKMPPKRDILPLYARCVNDFPSTATHIRELCQWPKIPLRDRWKRTSYGLEQPKVE